VRLAVKIDTVWDGQALCLSTEISDAKLAEYLERVKRTPGHAPSFAGEWRPLAITAPTALLSSLASSITQALAVFFAGQ